MTGSKTRHLLDRRIIQAVLAGSMGLIAVAMLLALGEWQLGRSKESDAAIRQMSTVSVLPIFILGQTKVNTESDQYRLVEATGEYLPEYSLLLDNRSSVGRPGYHVYTPFSVAQNDSQTVERPRHVVLLNRGWVPAGDHGSEIPQFETPVGELTIRGRLNLPPSRPVFFGDSDVVATGTVWQYLDLDDVSAWTGFDLGPMEIELDAAMEDVGGFVRQWDIIDNARVERQFYGAYLAFALALIIGVSFVSRLIHRFRH
jgi:surfeit locus 1 family protein